MKRNDPVCPFLLILFSTLIFTSCSTAPAPEPVVEPAAAPLPEADAEFQEVLAVHLSRPEAGQADRHARALDHLEYVERFEHEAHQSKDASLRHWYYEGLELDRSTYGVGLGNSLRELLAACELDPTFAEAWCQLGRLSAVAGDLVQARRYLDRARAAALARSQTGRPLDHEDQLEIFRNRAWVLRDLGLWEEGLDAVQEGLRFHRGDPDLVLIKGLCLAGAGRYEEAVSLAVRMKPFSYPQLDVFHYGAREQTSDFAGRWIKSQAALAEGDHEMARHVLGELGSYPYRWYLPHQKRFFTDVGLAAELAGDTEAGTYYAIGLISDHYYGFYPWSAGNLGPLVLDVPNERAPYFTTFGGRFYLGGSLLSYAARQMNLMAMSSFEKQRARAAWRALQALDMAERRHIRPDVARAMRGRVYFSRDERQLARRDLLAACEAFRAAGTIDPGTSLLLGLLEMSGEDYAAAAALFEEAVGEDPELAVGWRSLGVCRARLEQAQPAAVAMDRALELEPRSVSGLYNRGLLALQNREFAEAGAYLDRAFRLDPENHEVQRLLQMAAANLKAEGGDPGEITLLAEQAEREAGGMDPDRMLASLEKDIEMFFAVPDSIQETISSEDEVVASLRAHWIESEDPVVRRLLALAYLDRRMYTEAQQLLAPGWGVDLSPEEEVMLLYADRTLGEEQRTRDLVRMLNSGEEGLINPYLLVMLPKEDRLHWKDSMLAGNHYFEGYGAADMQGMPDAIRFAFYMRVGWQNVRMGLDSVEQQQPFFRFLIGEDGVGSATSGNRPTSGKKVGNVIK